MAPKPQVKKAPQGTKVSATNKAVNDFLAQSSVPAGLLERQENDKKQKVRVEELSEKYLRLISPSSIQLNMDSLNKCRVVSNIYSGICAGILGYGAGSGLMFWLCINALTAALIYGIIKMMGAEEDGESKFFPNPFQMAAGGLFGNVMTYLLFWIMFYNLVYVI
jgi:hypothetical protein